MAELLNTAFHSLDGAVFSAMHSLAESAGGFFTPFAKTITFLGEKGIIFFAAAIVLMLYKNTRRAGVCLFGAVACGALITSVILKDAVARPRPFLSEEYKRFWEYVGSPEESGYSFPSGHVTATAAAMLTAFLFFNKKKSWAGFLVVVLMGFSRVYLIAHYFSDVLAGVIVGAISAVIAYFITKLIFYFAEKHKDKKFCSFIINFDVKMIFQKKDEA